MHNALVIKLPELRQNPKQRLGLAGEIEFALRLVIIDSLDSVAVVKQKNPVPLFVDQQTAKETIQFLKEPIALFLIEMNQPAPGRFSQFMSFSLELGARFGIGEAFSREEEGDVFLLIEENLTRGKGVPVRHPTRVNPHFRVRT